MLLELSDPKMLLMPRKWFLKKLNPAGAIAVPELRRLLKPHMLEYKAMTGWVPACTSRKHRATTRNGTF
jgi:hypothetical protein